MSSISYRSRFIEPEKHIKTIKSPIAQRKKGKEKKRGKEREKKFSETFLEFSKIHFE